MDDSAHLNPPAALPAILERTEALAFPMPSEPRTGAMLRVLAATKPGGRLLDGMDRDARLTTVDVDRAVQQVARSFLGADVRLDIVTEDAGQFLHRQQPETFDLILGDAMKGKYELLDEALALLRQGGLYVVDDMLPQESWPEGHAPNVPRLIADLASRPGFRTVSLAWSSGLVVVARQH